MKTQSDLTIVAKNSLGILERILRLVRHRRFILNNVSAHCEENSNAVNIRLVVESDRDLGNLMLQLQKLMDVIEVRQSHEYQLRNCLGYG